VNDLRKSFYRHGSGGRGRFLLNRYGEATRVSRTSENPGTESRGWMSQKAGTPEKENREGRRDKQDYDRIALALIANHPDQTEDYGQRRTQQYEGFYKNPQGTASARVQDEQQRHSDSQDPKDLRCGFAIVH
jgi:hypothetical protein